MAHWICVQVNYWFFWDRRYFTRDCLGTFGTVGNYEYISVLMCVRSGHKAQDYDYALYPKVIACYVLQWAWSWQCWRICGWLCLPHRWIAWPVWGQPGRGVVGVGVASSGENGGTFLGQGTVWILQYHWCRPDHLAAHEGRYGNTHVCLACLNSIRILLLHCSKPRALTLHDILLCQTKFLQ